MCVCVSVSMWYVCVCVSVSMWCVCVCVCECLCGVCTCVCVCVPACIHVWVYVWNLLDASGVSMKSLTEPSPEPVSSTSLQ